MGAFEELAEVAETRENRFLRDWKDQGKKVVGYVCTYMPEEILYAADILPYRITGNSLWIEDNPPIDGGLILVTETVFAADPTQLPLDVLRVYPTRRTIGNRSPDTARPISGRLSRGTFSREARDRRSPSVRGRRRILLERGDFLVAGSYDRRSIGPI